mmetsp:Transcript_137952/g.440591  ORF Transcript_137952/g.440591 Transcript_137952/m.440591 type:complete len:258 (+) Transcript_137952:4811-5584(+)
MNLYTSRVASTSDTSFKNCPTASGGGSLATKVRNRLKEDHWSASLRCKRPNSATTFQKASMTFWISRPRCSFKVGNNFTKSSAIWGVLCCCGSWEKISTYNATFMFEVIPKSVDLMPGSTSTSFSNGNFGDDADAFLQQISFMISGACRQDHESNVASRLLNIPACSDASAKYQCNTFCGWCSTNAKTQDHLQCTLSLPSNISWKMMSGKRRATADRFVSSEGMLLPKDATHFSNNCWSVVRVSTRHMALLPKRWPA